MVDAELVHELHRAIKQADLGEVRRLVQLHSFQAEALINAIEEEYEVAALHTAAECGHVPTAMFLLDNGADVNIRDSGERSPLHRAAEAEDGVMIDFLILRGADTRLTDYRGMRAIEFCYEHGYVAEVLRKESPAACFVRHGAKVNLDQAIRLGLTEQVEDLLEHPREALAEVHPESRQRLLSHYIYYVLLLCSQTGWHYYEDWNAPKRPRPVLHSVLEKKQSTFEKIAKLETSQPITWATACETLKQCDVALLELCVSCQARFERADGMEMYETDCRRCTAEAPEIRVLLQKLGFPM